MRLALVDVLLSLGGCVEVAIEVGIGFQVAVRMRENSSPTSVSESLR
jgi:hypothetical protein